MNLHLLQDHLFNNGIEAFMLPINDEFFSEWVPKHNQRLSWLTGFSGSYGFVIVSQDGCHFFTDGRYLTQLKTELNNENCLVHNIRQVKPWDLIQSSVAYDPKLFTYDYLKKFHCNLIEIAQNPIDLLWHDRKLPKEVTVYKHEEIYSGMSSLDKCQKVAQNLPLLVNYPDSVSWLLNLRSDEVECNPCIFARAILYPNCDVRLFVQDYHKISYDIVGSNVEILPLTDLENIILDLKGVYFDKKSTSIYYNKLIDFASVKFYQSSEIANNKNYELALETDLCELPKACKNACEINGAIEAHILDGVAYIEFFHWLYNNIGVTELEASLKLLELRKKSPLCVGNSFETISAFGANGAIIHYRPTKDSNKAIVVNGIYLLDSGGQYLNATTDITRTLAIGLPTKQQIKNYNLVLKGLINLSTAVFPSKIHASQLDALARIYLWRDGYDFPHGTGHGVGSFLSVHEGPQGFGAKVALRPGMIISNEPGYYAEGEYGIRLENLMYVYNFAEDFLAFKTLTMVPFDIKMLDFTMLTTQEHLWVKSYHEEIFEKLRDRLSGVLCDFYIANFLL